MFFFWRGGLVSSLVSMARLFDRPLLKRFLFSLSRVESSGGNRNKNTLLYRQATRSIQGLSGFIFDATSFIENIKDGVLYSPLCHSSHVASSDISIYIYKHIGFFFLSCRVWSTSLFVFHWCTHLDLSRLSQTCVTLSYVFLFTCFFLYSSLGFHSDRRFQLATTVSSILFWKQSRMTYRDCICHFF